MTKIVDDLENRALLQDATNKDKINQLPVGTPFYVGFDPTAPYLHLGNLIPILTAIRLSKAGLKPILLFGGATGFIGDPNGKSKERVLLDRETIERNVTEQSTKVKEILARLEVEAEFVDNYEWTHKIDVLTFLRDFGKHFSLNVMIAKDTVKTRLAGNGISYTEFSYMVLQALDFVHLFKTRGCSLQIGGSDQWGNITAGVELIRKSMGEEVQAFTIPLLVDSTGAKFGKSAGNALWIDERGTSPYQIHQYFLNTNDNDVIRYLKIFTFLDDEEIIILEKEVTENPGKRAAQKELADKVTALIHGDDALTAVRKTADVLFGGNIDNISAKQLEEIFGDVPSVSLDSSSVLGVNVIDIFVQAGALKSKGEARRLLAQGGIYLNSNRITDSDYSLSQDDLIDGSLLLLRSGKKNYRLVKTSVS